MIAAGEPLAVEQRAGAGELTGEREALGGRWRWAGRQDASGRGNSRVSGLGGWGDTGDGDSAAAAGERDGRGVEWATAEEPVGGVGAGLQGASFS